MAWMSRPSAKACVERLDVGDVGEHAQFDLRIVGRDQLVAPPATKAVRILRPSSVRTGMFCRFGSLDDSRPVEHRGLRIGGVHSPGARVDVAGQRIGIGGFELGELAPVEDSCAAVVAFGGEVVEHLRRSPTPRSWSCAAGQPHAAEQDVAELLGRAEIEALAGEFVGLVLESRGRWANSPDSRDSICRSTQMPRYSMRASTGDQRPLQRLVESRKVLGGRRGLRMCQSRSVTSASSAA